MATTTSKLALTKPDTSDLVDIAVLNQNSDKLDAAAGATVCTSATRPSSPYNGQVIYETDTNAGYVYRSSTTSWLPIASGATVCTSSTRPSAPYAGQIIFETNTYKTLIYASSSWQEVVNTYSVKDSTVARVASSTVRDALFPSPVQFDSVFRKDLGREETYLAAYDSGTNPLGAATAGWYEYPQSSLKRVVGSVVSNSTSSGVIKFVLPATTERLKLRGRVLLNQTTSHGSGNTGVTFGFGSTTGGVGTWTVNTGFTSYSMYPGGAALANTMSVPFEIAVEAELAASTTPDFRMSWTVGTLSGLSGAGPATGFLLEYYTEPFRA